MNHNKDKEYARAIALIREGADILKDSPYSHHIMADIHLDDDGLYFQEVDVRNIETPEKDIAEVIRFLADMME